MLNQADVLSAESQVAQSELLLERATSLSSLNEQRLRTAMHDDSGASYEIGENVDAELSKLAHTQELRALQRQALERRLELKALAESARALNQQANSGAGGATAAPGRRRRRHLRQPEPARGPVARRVQGLVDGRCGPELDAQRHPRSGSPGPQLGGQGQRDRRRQARARGRDRRGDRGRASGPARGRKAIDTSQRRLRSAEEAYRVRTVLFQNGRATGVELTDAETELARARLDLISSRVGLRIARVQLDHATGMDVR